MNEKRVDERVDIALLIAHKPSCTDHDKMIMHDRLLLHDLV